MSPPGSHKPNTAVPQAYYNKVFGIENITTETGAGQWGSALSFACSQYGLTCKVFMVRISFDQKPYRKSMMQAWGGKCIASPSNETKAGRDALAKDPNTPGSLGIAISEAVEAAVGDTSGKTRYSLGSVLNHVMLHQTIIGLEAKRQLEIAGEYPDIVIGCAGGGSNFAGLAFPFVLDKINGKAIDIYPVEPKACPSMTRAPFAYDHGDTAGYTPLLPMHSLGHNFVPAPIHAGGLRYHGMAPTVSQLINEGLISPKSVGQMESYKAGVLWARTEGFIPAPETNNALAQVVAEARKPSKKEKKKPLCSLSVATVFWTWARMRSILPVSFPTFRWRMPISKSQPKSLKIIPNPKTSRVSDEARTPGKTMPPIGWRCVVCLLLHMRGGQAPVFQGA